MAANTIAISAAACFQVGRPGMKTLRKLIANNKGATAIEYGLIAALIAIAAITAMTSLGSQLSLTFGKATSKMAETN